MSIGNYLLNNFVMLFELVGLLIILFISAHVSKKIKIYTRTAVFLIFASILVTAFETWTQSFETLSPWRVILTALKYTIYPLILIDIIFLVVQNMKPFSKKWLLILSLPELIAIPLYFTSQWTGLVFKFSETNHYGGGPLNNLPYIIFAFYLAVFVVLNIVYLHSYSVRNRIIALYISLVSAACVVVYLIVGKTDDYNPILTSSLVFYFLFLYIHNASIDALTGLRNRQSYYQDLSESGHRITYVASVDMNDLKVINDTKGHAAGDQALIEVADLLKNNIGPKARCYRVGGDEFMILFILENQKEFEMRIEKIRAALKNSPYVCAFGYAQKNADVSLDDVIKEADRQMYINKSDLKSGNKKLN